MSHIIDTSALVALSGINKLDVLKACCATVIIPKAVRIEVVDQGDGWIQASAAQTEIAQGQWIWTQAVPPSPFLDSLNVRLGAGEAQALALAKTLSLPLIVDDLAARREADRLKIVYYGSLRILAWGKRNGLVREVRPLIEAMQENGIHLAPTLIEQFLKNLGE